jgi:hypothetical protein
MEERMTVDRRSFFKGGIVATLFAGIPGSVAALAQIHKKPTPKLFRPKSLDNLARLSMDSFSPFVDTTFTLRGVTTKIPVTLNRVSDLRKTPGEIALAQQGREFFLLEFTAPSSTSLPQGTYEFRNDSLGVFSLMVVPGVDGTYQATINRLYS